MTCQWQAVEAAEPEDGATLSRIDVTIISQVPLQQQMMYSPVSVLRCRLLRVAGVPAVFCSVDPRRIALRSEDSQCTDQLPDNAAVHEKYFAILTSESAVYRALLVRDACKCFH